LAGQVKLFLAGSPRVPGTRLLQPPATKISSGGEGDVIVQNTVKGNFCVLQFILLLSGKGKSVLNFVKNLDTCSLVIAIAGRQVTHVFGNIRFESLSGSIELSVGSPQSLHTSRDVKVKLSL
jgi:hypothetical protein